MTHGRHPTPRGRHYFKGEDAVEGGNEIGRAKRQRARGEKVPSNRREGTPRTLARFVSFSPRAHGLSVTPPSSGYATRRRVFGRGSHGQAKMQDTEHDDGRRIDDDRRDHDGGRQ